MLFFILDLSVSPQKFIRNVKYDNVNISVFFILNVFNFPEARHP